MYLNLFTNPVQSIAKLALTYLVNYFSLPTLTITLFTTLYQTVRVSIETVGVVPTINTLFLIRRFITSDNVLSVVGLQSLIQSTSSLTANPIIEALIPFLSNCITNTTKWLFLKLFNLFVVSIIITGLKKFIFRTVKLLFTGVTTLMASLFYFELPSLDFIRELIKPLVILKPEFIYISKNGDDFMERLSQVLWITTALLITYKNLDYNTAMDILDSLSNGGYNLITAIFRAPINLAYKMFNYFFPPNIR